MHYLQRNQQHWWWNCGKLMIIPQRKLLPQQMVQAWDSRNSFRNSTQVLLTWEMFGRSCSAPSCGFHDSRLRLPNQTLGLRTSMCRAGTQPKLAESQRVFLQLVSDRGSKGGDFQDLLVYKQNWKHNTSSERLEVLFQPLCHSHSKICILICCINGDK